MTSIQLRMPEGVRQRLTDITGEVYEPLETVPAAHLAEIVDVLGSTCCVHVLRMGEMYLHDAEHRF